jgi:glycosyltransferase involved in cell wall biosynthesis
MQPIAEHPAPIIRTAAPATVTLAIACYNQARYLRDAIESALAQTHPSVEILVVDDGSTDDTAAVAAAFPRVAYVRQANCGLAAARNTGLRMASGEFVAFLDADDKLLPRAIEAGIECFGRHPASAFVYGGYRNIFDDGSPAPTLQPQSVASDHYKHLLEGNFIGMHGTVLYRRTLVAAAGGFNEALRACEDYELYLRLARQHRIQGHSTVVAEYRQHDTNMSRDYAFMLRSALAVLSLERNSIRERRHRRAARTGVRVWKEYYGTLLFEQWLGDRNARGLLKVFRLWPTGVLRKIGARLSRLVRKRRVRFGSLRRTEPVSRQFGFDRGLPVDRYYIDAFLSTHAVGIHGHVLEIGDDAYSRRFGAKRITLQDVLHVVPGSPGATIIADLAHAPHIPSAEFDCIILTQTLHYIFDVRAAVETLHRILKPGGTVLATLPGISAVCRDQQDRDSDCWRFTVASARRLFAATFGGSNVEARSYGNVLAAVAFLEGLAAKELRPAELDHHDPDYQVTIAVRAVKGENG